MCDSYIVKAGEGEAVKMMKVCVQPSVLACRGTCMAVLSSLYCIHRGVKKDALSHISPNVEAVPQPFPLLLISQMGSVWPPDEF